MIYIRTYVSKDYHWLMSEYVWKATSVGLEMENEADTTSAFVPGLGSMPNCHLRLVNIIEDKLETHDNGNIGRGRTDPGVGSMTPYYDRPTYANRNIQEGQELFVGESIFALSSLCCYGDKYDKLHLLGLTDPPFNPACRLWRAMVLNEDS